MACQDVGIETQRRQWRVRSLDGRVLQFYKAGMGINGVANAEVNLLTFAKRGNKSKISKQLDHVWPEMETVANLSEDLLQGPSKDPEVEDQEAMGYVPLAFISANYRSGSDSKLCIDVDPTGLPTEWECQSLPNPDQFRIDTKAWKRIGMQINDRSALAAFFPANSPACEVVQS